MKFGTKSMIGVGLLAIALSAGLWLGGCDRRQSAGAAPPGMGGAQVPEVNVITVRSQPATLTTELPGRTSAYLVAEIRPQVNGLIQKRLFTEGSDVKAGEVLYQIEPAPFQAALSSAEAALGRAQASLTSVRSRVDRYKELLSDKAVSQQDFDDANSALNQVNSDIQYYRATAETARINLGYTKVVAPISGRIGRSSVTDGALVTAYQPVPLATIQQLDPIYVDVPQSTTDLLKLNRRLADGHLNAGGDGQNKARLLLEDGSEYAQQGELQFRDVTVDPTTGSFVLRIVFPNPKAVLLPGMFVRAVVKEGVSDKAILVPQQAVTRTTKGDPMAMIVDPNNKVQPRMLTVDRAIGAQWLVTSGLVSGDRVIIEGLQKVRPGAAVKIAAEPAGPQSVKAADAKSN
jgi:membrane fusion protein, multidrug efflux system